MVSLTNHDLQQLISVMSYYYVYILKCADNSYYVGVTNNLEKRIWEHDQGIIKGYTYGKRSVTLVYYQEFRNINEAITFEKQLKGWRRAKKEALIENNISRLKELARNYKSHPSSSSG